MPLLQRLRLPLLISAVQLAAAAAVLGRPSLPRVVDFFASSAPTVASAIAASQLTIWLILLFAFAASLATAARGTATRIDDRRRKRVWGTLVMLVGLTILVAGVGHQVNPARVSLGGGSLQEAQQQIAR
jgi:predicted PurR-regulated permease PerM